MKHPPEHEQLELYILGELPPDEAARIGARLNEAPDTQHKLQSAKRMLEALDHSLAEPKAPPDLAEQIIARLPSGLPRTSATRQTRRRWSNRKQSAPAASIHIPRHLNDWRLMMSRPIPRLVAAVVLAAVLFTLGWTLLSGGTQVALADFIKPILEARSATYTLTVEREGKPVDTCKSMVLEPGRSRGESLTNGRINIVDVKEKRWVILDPKKKSAAVFEYENAPEDWVPNYFDRLRAHLRQTQSEPNVKREALGEKEIDGRRVIGFRISTPFQVTEIWGDPETALPVRVESKSATDPKVKIVKTDFAFNVELEESLFSVKPPEGYVVQKASFDVSPPEEKDLIAAFRAYSDTFDGSFPDALPGINMELVVAIREKHGVKLDAQPNDEQFKGIMQLSLLLGRGLGDFPGSLPPEADAHYGGKGVKRNAPDTPVFWYRPEAGKAYRVIHADLSVRESDAAPKVPKAQRIWDSSDAIRRPKSK